MLYGAVVERVIKPSSTTQMPCYTKQDGVDFMPMPAWRVFLIQFLNIAGTGPIFGAIMGILFGPAAYLWIVFGCIFAGAVHDYLCGMICIRQGGVSLPEIIGNELGDGMRLVMRVGALVLLVLVGAVFVTTPASLLDNMTPDKGWFFSNGFWLTAIFLYFILATLLPIDKLIGRVYPVFGFALLAMAIGIGWNIYTQEGWMPELTDAPFVTHHPKGLPIFPMLCITIACGAISGFHGTQSPLMARCLTSERLGRPIFYGAMITEGVVALIWAAAAVKFASMLPGEEGATAYEKLAALGNPAIVVKEISTGWMGAVGAVLAILGVVAAPITSGDTAFRSARLIAADFLHLGQKRIVNRLMLCLCHHDGLVLHRLQRTLALLRLDEPDAGLHHALGSNGMASETEEALLDCFPARPLYDGGLYQLHPHRARGLWPLAHHRSFCRPYPDGNTGDSNPL